MNLRALDRAQIKAALPRWFRGSAPTFSRKYDRRDCALLGDLRILDSGVVLHGALLELSCGGCSFRPASMFLLERMGEGVEIVTEHFSVEAVIRSTRPEAYGVQFKGELDMALVKEIIDNYPRPPHDGTWIPRR